MIPKFKVWDKKTKSILNIESWHVEDEYFDLIEPNKNVADPKANRVWRRESDVILMQSTGLFDKNGEEIFEGDMVRVGGWKIEVVKFGEIIHEEDFGGFAIYQGFSLMLGGGYPEATMNELEVIGNIYQNSDLLESVE